MTDITFRSDIVARGRDNMGGDETVIEAMLVSTDQDQLIEEMSEIPKTEGRIRYLMRKRHGTPFEHNAMKFYVEAPIFVFREWHRHRIGWSYNEQSGRYSELPPMFYIPSSERPLIQVGKPGDYHYEVGSPQLYSWLIEDMKAQAMSQYVSYQLRLMRDVAKEVARMSLGVNIYSKMYATCNARSLMAFLSLRTSEGPFWEALTIGDPEAVKLSISLLREAGHDYTAKFLSEVTNDLFTQNQGGAIFPSTPMWEIEAAARMTEDFFSQLFPLTYKAFNDFGRVCP